MATSKTRQRALARAKLERQIARRAANARRRRQIQAGAGAALAVILVVVGIVWATGGFEKKKVSTAAEDCAWTPQKASDTIKDVGKPPTTKISKTGTSKMTITTSVGVVEAELDRAGAPCTAASFAYLAAKKFFDASSCHRLTTDGIYVLQCGDPSGTGQGGPAYQFPDEKLPSPADDPSADPNASAAPSANLYPAGSLAMANSGPNTNGSQFFIVYKDGSSLEAKYTLFGKVTKGLDLIQKVAEAGHDNAFAQAAGGGHPKTEVKIKSLTVTADAPAPTSSGATS